MTFRPGWHTPDALGHDAHTDEIACPDIHGTEPAGRPLKLRPLRVGVCAAESSAPASAVALLPSAGAGAEPPSDARQPSGGHRPAA